MAATRMAKQFAKLVSIAQVPRQLKDSVDRFDVQDEVKQKMSQVETTE
jgi:hypothetical protein